jgi:hypothetical protein
MKSDRRNTSKSKEIVSNVSGGTPETRHALFPVISKPSVPCVGSSGQAEHRLPRGGQSPRATRRTRALRAALLAAVEAFCDTLEAHEPERRAPVRLPPRPGDGPFTETDQAEAKRVLKAMGVR